MLKSCSPFVGKGSDELLWSLKLQRHASGDFSMAVVQGNEQLEDQCQVLTSNVYTMVGLYDGHGGSFAARFVNDNLIPRLQSLVAQAGMSEAAVLAAFSETEADFYQLVSSNGSPNTRVLQEVGCCCILGVISKGRLYVANLGDSRAVMGYRTHGIPIDAQRLTTDHNVNDVEHRKEFVDQHDDVPDIVTLENGTFFVKGFLQVTKSIGDFYLKRNSMRRDNIEFEDVVDTIEEVDSTESEELDNIESEELDNIEFEHPLLSAVPVVTDRILTPRDQFVIFASKCFWDLMSDQAAVDIVYNSKRSGIAKRLIKAAIHQAARNFHINYAGVWKLGRDMRRNVHDDISVVVLFFDHHPRSGFTTGSARPPIDIFAYSQSA